MAIELPNKITKESLDHLVAQSDVTYNNLAGTLTHCMVALPCGFQVTGESACVDPANYDKELGEKYALEQAVEKLWPLEGYLLANDLYRAKEPSNHIARMIFENAQLMERLDKLCELLSKPQPEFISDKQWLLLQDQQKHMTGYFNTLDERIEDLASESGV